MQFFYREADKICKAHLGQFMWFDPVGAPSKIVKVTPELIANINTYVYCNLKKDGADDKYDSLQN